jgi:hypothetical protein
MKVQVIMMNFDKTNHRQSKKRSRVLTAAAGAAIVAGLVIVDHAIAQTSPSTNMGAQTTEVRFNPIPGQSVGFAPQGSGAPRRTATGGRRSGQLAEMPVLLLPPSQGALTAAARPNFWVYVPAGTTGEGHFRLTDAQQTDLNYQEISLPASGGLVQITLPDTLEPLATGETYRWFFSATTTDENDRTQDVFASGWIERNDLSAELAQSLQSTTGSDRAALYAQAGFWQDTVDVLAQLRQQQPQNPELATIWNQLMEQVELNHPAIMAEAITQ